VTFAPSFSPVAAIDPKQLLRAGACRRCLSPSTYRPFFFSTNGLHHSSFEFLERSFQLSPEKVLFAGSRSDFFSSCRLSLWTISSSKRSCCYRLLPNPFFTGRFSSLVPPTHPRFRAYEHRHSSIPTLAYKTDSRWPHFPAVNRSVSLTLLMGRGPSFPLSPFFLSTSRRSPPRIAGRGFLSKIALTRLVFFFFLWQGT